MNKGEEDKNVEIKMRTFGTEHQKKAVFLVVNACSSKDYMNNIVGVCFVGQDITGQKVVMDKFIHIQSDYRAIVHSPNPLIPPIFASDENACCLEWNTAMEKLTGWNRGKVIEKMLYTDKFPFSFFDRNGKFVQALLKANKRINMGGQIIGDFCFLQIVSPELQQALNFQRQQEKKCFTRMKELAYIYQEIKNPLSGIRFTNLLLEATDLTEDQKQFLETSAACEKQMMKIIRDVDLQSIEDGMVCAGEGLAPELVQDMFHNSHWTTEEGLGLSMCRMILKLVQGEVQYIRESERCYFLVILDLPLPRRGAKSVH
ncbi:hypothetical protein GH714_039802 [Hevea brasiliensis]|uniref:PAS domain-containing protein n=1 Tax=Hevea brasiliensis TaxID=3981 RepID=A0A6A6MHI3_HEVBR|nr:hypothetical protein GH714_039802 [Hevea brasiliensis]